MRTDYKSYCLILLLLLWGTQAVFSQTKLQLADRHFHNYEYSEAITFYKSTVKSKKPGFHVTQRLADCYRLTNNYAEAEAWYVKTVSFNQALPINRLYLAEALRNNSKYTEAKDQFLIYGKMVPQEKELAQRLANACDVAAQWMAVPTMIEVKNETQLNSPNSDFSPVFVKDGIIFTSDRKTGTDADKRISLWTGNPYLKLFFTKQDSIHLWNEPTLIKDEDIDHPYDNGPATVSKNADLIYFTRSNKIKNPAKLVGKENVAGFINRLEIYSAKRDGNTWENLLAFPYNNFTKFSIGHPALSPDGKIIYFASDMPGGFGETDLYFCEKKSDGSWSKPVNLGTKINSSGKEVFPVLAPDGTLYFSSNGHTGLGGLDLFSAKGTLDNWKEVENLKFPMNSPQDDFGIVLDTTGKAGYFSSNRTGGIGMDDIYSFKKPTCILSGLALERMVSRELPLGDVNIKLYKKGDTTTVIAYEQSAGKSKATFCRRSYEPCKIISDAHGQFFFELQQEETYQIKGNKNGYFTQTAEVMADCRTSTDTLQVAMNFNKIILNKPMLIKNIFFDDDKLYVRKNIYYDLDEHEIRPDAAIELDKLVELLQDNPSIKIELGSHTDSRESDEYNYNLSLRRAQAAVDYIVRKGIDKNVIKAKGYGESEIKNKCKDGFVCSEEDHQMNRRTEIKVTEIIPEGI